MRTPSFLSDDLRMFLRSKKIATLPELKQALGSAVDTTVFRKLKDLSYHSSYSHRGRYYTLAEIPQFDPHGLWSFQSVWFSRWGTLVSTVKTLVSSSSQGYFANELLQLLHVEAKDALLQLFEQKRIARQLVTGLFLFYTAPQIRRCVDAKSSPARRSRTSLAALPPKSPRRN